MHAQRHRHRRRNQRRILHRGQLHQPHPVGPGQDLVEQAVAGREPQDQVAGVAGQPAGDGDQPPPQGGDHGLAAAYPVAVHDVLAEGRAGELVQPGGHGGGEQRPHIHARLTWGYPDGRCRRAVPSLLSRNRFSPDRCPLHWAGNHLAAIIIPGQSGTYRHLPGRVTGLLADSGLKSITVSGDCYPLGYSVTCGLVS